MVRDFSNTTWEEAVRGFILHKRAVRAKKTARWYETYVTQLMFWANQNRLPLNSFTKRHLDEYLVYRAEKGRSATTVHHDALVATVFTEWCKKNDLLDRDPLSEYRVRNAPETYKYMPSLEDVQRLLQGVLDFYDVQRNPAAKYIPPKQRSFYRDRNYAIELAKLDSACRIGEIFAFKVSDYQQTETGMQFVVRQAKGRRPRILPASKECAEAMEQWLKVRKRVMGNVPHDEDEGWLFLSSAGTQVDPGNYLRGIKSVLEFAGLPKEMNNHSQRRFSINDMAKEGDLLFAQEMAGHRDPKTTRIYTKLSSDFLRDKQELVGVLRKVLVSTRSVKKRRLV